MKFSEEEKETVAYMRGKNKSYGEIAKVLGCAKDRINKYCNRNNLGGFRNNAHRDPEKAFEAFKINLHDKTNGELIYVSGYDGCDSNVLLRIKSCGHEITKNAQFARKSKDLRGCKQCAEENKVDRKPIQCRNCNKFFEGRLGRKTCSEECKIEYGRFNNATRGRVKQKSCKRCDVLFETEYKRWSYTYCSEECKKEDIRSARKASKLNRKYKNKTLKNGGRYDNGITLERLKEEYNNVCYLCGDECDSEDFQITEEGHFVAGPNHPSIEHIKPISKGGSHTWDNVNLAHCRCNYIKSDKETVEDVEQVELLI